MTMLKPNVDTPFGLSERAAQNASGRLVNCEGRLLYTTEVGVGCNLKKYIRCARLFESAQDDEPAVRAALLELSTRVVSSAFLDSANNAKYMPYTEAGVKKQMLAELDAVAETFEAECLRLANAKRESVYEASCTEAGKAMARATLGIKGYDPYPNQQGGQEFQEAWKRFRENETVQAQASAEAEAAATATLQPNRACLGKQALVGVVQRLRDKFGTTQGAVDALFAQCLEVTAVLIACTSFDGIEAPYGSAGLVVADAHTTDRPSLHHLSREPALALAREMERGGQLRSLGVSGVSVGLNMPGMPPFFFGDITEGHDYAQGGNYAQQMSQGNQWNDAGAHVTIITRADSAGLALSNKEYDVPVLARVRELWLQGEAGMSYELQDDGPQVEATINFELNTAMCKLVQGQARNDTLVGGDRYVGLAAQPPLLEIVRRFQLAVMPAGFLLDLSFCPHVSVAVLTLRGLPHYKSVPMQHLAACLQPTGCDMAKFYAAHQEAHRRSRRAWSPAVTNWDVYEDAASKFPGCKYNDRLLDLLGYKTAVVSHEISSSDELPTTTYNGKGASAELRYKGNDTSIVRWGAGGIRDFGLVQGFAYYTHVTGDTYARHRISDANQPALVFDVLATFTRSLGVDYEQQVRDALGPILPGPQLARPRDQEEQQPTAAPNCS